MNSPYHDFNSKQAVENWIQTSLASGLSENLIYTFLIKKSEELNAKREHYLLRRREELVNGNTHTATELHLLMKECEQQALWFSELSESLSIVSVQRASNKLVNNLFIQSVKIRGKENLN